MTLTRHSFRGEADLSRILDLVRAMPLSSRHVLDLPWRLSAPVINEGRDGSFWEDANGQVVGFAAWQYYWAALDFFILPGPTEQEVAKEIFAWADARMGERDEERGYPLPYWVEFRDDDSERLQLVKAHGFVLEDAERYTLFHHPLNNLAPVRELPAGFTLRPLLGEQEVAGYAELHRFAFESASMASEWRAHSLRAPHYRSDLDLVICASDGSLAAFCVGWFDQDRRVAQIEPIGVHPDFRRRGLARALFLEMLHRFRAHGATSACIEPFSENVPIHRASEAVGFQRVHTIHRLGKWINQPV